jgi:hypothetical protein
MGIPCPIGRTKNEKSGGIPKSVEHPSKPCREKFSEDHDMTLKKFSGQFKEHGVLSLSKTSKISSSHG